MSIWRPNHRMWSDWKKTKPIGKCDYAHTLVRYEDMRHQYVWQGNSLQWNGMLVHKDYIDHPNAQAQIPKVYPDPIPVGTPRPYPGYMAPVPPNT